MALEITDLGEFAVELDVMGRLDQRDYERLNQEVERRLGDGRKIGLVVNVTRLRGWTPQALWEDLKFDAQHYSDVERLAIVSADGHKRWLAGASRLFTGAQVQWYPERDDGAARAWVRGSQQQ